MRTIVHLSDLHFGRVDARLLAPLRDVVLRIAPDLLVVSGDLTQRARSGQFQDARRFLDTLPAPQVVVPGNHDVPLYNVFKRFLGPLDRFRRYISLDVEPVYLDAEIAVIGINTARSMTFKNGRINAKQLARIRERFLPLAESVTKIVVTHHPFDLPDGVDAKNLLGRSVMAMHGLAKYGVDLLLAGHLHASHAGSTAARYPIQGYAALVVQAGTATSTRGRGENNSFNVLRIQHPETTIERYEWDEGRKSFLLAHSGRFHRQGNGWAAADAVPVPDMDAVSTAPG